MVQFSNGQPLSMAPTFENPDVNPDLKQLDFRTSDPIQNPDIVSSISQVLQVFFSIMLKVVYSDQHLCAARREHVVYSDQLLGAAL